MKWNTILSHLIVNIWLVVSSHFGPKWLVTTGCQQPFLVQNGWWQPVVSSRRLKYFHNEKKLLFSIGVPCNLKKELEQLIARTLFLMHKSTFRARYVWFFRYLHRKFTFDIAIWFFFKKNSMKIRSLLIFRMFINSLCLYSDFYIYNNLSFISNESCTIQSRLERYKKNCISYSIKKIIVRSNKKIVFRSASSSARAILYLYFNFFTIIWQRCTEEFEGAIISSQGN